MNDQTELRRDLEGDLVRVLPDGDGRTVELRLLAWGEVARTPQGPETFERGAFAGVDPAGVIIEAERHDGAVVGRGLTLQERADAAYLTARVSDTAAGRDLLTLVNDGVLRGASISFAPLTSRLRPDGVTSRAAVDLRRVALLHRGAYTSAGVLAVRTEAPAMDEHELTTAPAVDLSPILERMSAQDEALSRLSAAVAGGATAAATVHELARFDSLGEAYLAAVESPEVRELLHRALTDQITTDNPGLVPPGWLNEIKGIVPASRPGITAFGGAAPLPATGMELDWPVLTPLVGDAIGVQATEKIPVTSIKVSFGKGSKAIATYAGASDVSYQILKRSQPAYRDAYARVMLSEYARVTDNVFVDTLAALTANTASWANVTDTNGAAFIALLFAESVSIETATGAPADTVVAATDVFLAIAGKSLIVPTAATTPQLGNATASTLEIRVSGLRVVHDRNLPAGKFLIGNSNAARWHEDGPFTVEVEDVEKLGRNIAYWGLGATAVYIPMGVSVGTMTGALVADAESAGKDKK